MALVKSLEKSKIHYGSADFKLAVKLSASFRKLIYLIGRDHLCLT